MNPFSGITYITRSRNWFWKLCAGAVVISIPVVKALADGYQIGTIERVMRNEPDPLPAWGDVWGDLRRGIKLYVAILAMYLPTLLFDLLVIVFSLYRWLGLIGSILRRFGASARHLPSSGHFAIASVIGDSALFPLLNLLALLLTLAMFFTVPALARRIADGSSFIGLFNPVPTWRLIFGNFGHYILARIIVFVVLLFFAVFLQFLTDIAVGTVILAPFIGTFGWFVLGLGRFWSRLVWAYHLGQMKESSDRELPRVVGGRWHSPVIATVASAVLPGAGQAYNGQPIRGCFVLLTCPLVIPYVYGVCNGYTQARRIEQAGGRVGRGGVVWLILQAWLAGNIVVAFMLVLTMLGYLQ